MAILYTLIINILLLDGGTIQQRKVTIDYELSIDYNGVSISDTAS